MTLYLSRLRLSRAPDARALRALIDPRETGPRLDAHHRLIWAVFADRADRTRDFLWREDGSGHFLTLSARPPIPTDLFDPPEVKTFAPDLRAGDRLAFTLRANATKDRPRGQLDPQNPKKDRRVDIVMDLLREVPGAETLQGRSPSARPERRLDLARQAAEAWMTRQGARAGFVPQEVFVQHYDAVTLPGHRGKRRGAPRLGILDLSGHLEVGDPETFVTALGNGFGRGKAFGCGLMLIRRA